MGAGIIKQSNDSCNQESNMSCTHCLTNFSLLKRKRQCTDCGRLYCSSCSVKSSKPPVRRHCHKCLFLTNGKFCRADLHKYTVKDLSLYLSRRNVPISNCKEKGDLIQALLQYANTPEYIEEQREHDRRTQELQDYLESIGLSHQRTGLNFRFETAEISPENNYPCTSSASSQNASNASCDIPMTGSLSSEQALRERQAREMEETEQRLYEELNSDVEPDGRAPPQYCKLEQLESEEAAEQLTIRQLKEVLVSSCVDYRGCCEKPELVERVKRLFREEHRNKQLTEEIIEREGKGGKKTGEEGAGDVGSDLCKICMDSVIDCVLLECGHMVACGKSGESWPNVLSVDSMS